MMAVVAQSMGGRVDAVRLGDVMERDVVCVSPDLEVGALRELLLERGISGAPVVDREGRPIGVVSKTDVLQACESRSAERVTDIMMPVSFKLTEAAPLGQAAALMAFEGVHRIVVVNTAGMVVGILTTIDVMRWLARESGYVVPG